MQTILLVEDNPHILKVNRAMFEKSGYRVLCAETVAETHALFREEYVDLLVLDIMLPDGDGVALCSELRDAEDTAATPVLFLSAKGESDDIVTGLRAGGDDYLSKPYDLEVLLARVEALLRRAEKSSQASSDTQDIICGPLTLEVATLHALVYGKDILLTPKEFLVLMMLVENEGTTLDKNYLYEKVWGQPMGDDSQALYTAVSRLKQKLEPCKDIIKLTAIRRIGYRLDLISRT